MYQKSLTINLDQPIQFEQWIYPAGETQVRLTPEAVEAVRTATDIRIIANIRSASDIMELLLLSDAVHAVAMTSDISLILPYYPYARADRRFTEGDCFGLAVFDQVLAVAGTWRNVVTFDKHSDVVRGNLPLINVSPWSLIWQIALGLSDNLGNRLNLLLPDEGALNRYGLQLGMSKIATHGFPITMNVLAASKNRDSATGKLSGFTVPAREYFLNGPVLIVDDICDGGGTFIGLADEMNEYALELHLYVSHGIFSKGCSGLLERFVEIHTTNTIDQRPKPERLIEHDVMTSLLSAAACSTRGGGSLGPYGCHCWSSV